MFQVHKTLLTGRNILTFFLTVKIMVSIDKLDYLVFHYCNEVNPKQAFSKKICKIVVDLSKEVAFLS